MGSRGLAFASQIQTWDGQHWRPADIPLTEHTGLSSVDAISSDDVWAVGASATPVGFHWDGTSWTRMTMGPSYGFTLEMTGVSASGPDDV